MSDTGKDDWEAHVEGALAASDSRYVVDLPWDQAVMYAHNRITELTAERDKLLEAARKHIQRYHSMVRVDGVPLPSTKGVTAEDIDRLATVIKEIDDAGI